ncbi:MAG: RHS repeat-associated core domain-containing protein, partial [Telluria sp.]
GGAANASQAGATRAASTDDHIHLPHVSQWDLPAARQEPTREDAEAEDRHRAALQKRQSDADNSALQDRIDQYNCDHLGTPRELIDQQGRVVWSVRYKAWGRVIREDVHEVEQPLRFQGQYGDSETGLHYNRYRYYDPEASRYVSPDPIKLRGTLNGYQYAPNPTGWIDPRGLSKSGPPCTALATYYPPNNGALGETKIGTLQPRTVVDRYGYGKGTYVSPVETPYPSRALPPDSVGKPYNIYDVVKPIEGVETSKIASWFGEIGGGTQHKLPESVDSLCNSGHLRKR